MPPAKTPRCVRSAPGGAQATRTPARAAPTPRRSVARRCGAAHARRSAPARPSASRLAPFGRDREARDVQRRVEAEPASAQRRRGTRAGARKRSARVSRSGTCSSPRHRCFVVVIRVRSPLSCRCCCCCCCLGCGCASAWFCASSSAACAPCPPPPPPPPPSHLLRRCGAGTPEPPPRG